MFENKQKCLKWIFTEKYFVLFYKYFNFRAKTSCLKISRNVLYEFSRKKSSFQTFEFSEFFCIFAKNVQNSNVDFWRENSNIFTLD